MMQKQNLNYFTNIQCQGIMLLFSREGGGAAVLLSCRPLHDVFFNNYFLMMSADHRVPVISSALENRYDLWWKKNNTDSSLGFCWRLQHAVISCHLKKTVTFDIFWTDLCYSVSWGQWSNLPLLVSISQLCMKSCVAFDWKKKGLTVPASANLLRMNAWEHFCISFFLQYACLTLWGPNAVLSSKIYNLSEVWNVYIKTQHAGKNNAYKMYLPPGLFTLLLFLPADSPVLIPLKWLLSAVTHRLPTKRWLLKLSMLCTL